MIIISKARIHICCIAASYNSPEAICKNVFSAMGDISTHPFQSEDLVRL
jgi:hypothetical protein